MSSLDRYAPEFKKVSSGAYEAIREIGRILDQHGSVIGRSKLVFADNIEPNPQSSLRQTSALAPPPAAFSVTGLDGKFIVAIANPQSVLPQSPAILQARAVASVNALNAPIIHNLQSASDTNFDNNSGITDYGLSSQLGYTFQNPNVTLFWRIRSSYDGQTWNAWQIFSDPTLCGPAGVYSGLLRTAALTQVNSANTPTTQPLTQSGVTTQINVASTTWTFGDVGTVKYNSGSVDPGVFGTFYVYTNDPKRAGGTVVYIATTAVSDITGNDAIVFFGKITTAGGGGGTGGGGGGGPCCIGEVEVEMFDGSAKAHKDLKRGDILKAIDGGEEEILRIELIPNIPCFRFTAENGLKLRGCSSRHLLQWDGGGFEPSEMIVGGNRLDTKLGPTKVEREFIGMRTVYKLTLSRTKTYFADGFISHNQSIK